jgi:5-aminopentanamidase
MKVAAYQAPLAATRSFGVIDLIREQVARCETLGVDVLCCPEGVLGGLADYCETPTDIAIDRDALAETLSPLASDSVATILGFTEIDSSGRLFSAAAVFHRGRVIGVYRKLHPAINRSVYSAGSATPVFTIGDLTFGIVICRDSSFVEPARVMAQKGAAAIFVPTSNGMPPHKTSATIIQEARASDVARATDNAVSIIRADVAGRTEELIAYGTSEIVNPRGRVIASAGLLEAGVIVADIDVPACTRL